MAQLKKTPADSSLNDRVSTEIGELRKTFQVVALNYQQRIDKELSDILSAITSLRRSKAQVVTLRDMLAAIRNLQVRPEKGRRKDLRKIDALVGDLSLLVEDLRQPVKGEKKSGPKSATKPDPKTRNSKR